MPIHFEVVDGTVRTTMAGVVTSAEVVAHLHALEGNTETPDVFVEVVDLSAVDDIQIMSTDARRIAERASTLHGGHEASYVIVVATDPLTFGVSRMLDAYVTVRNPTCRWYSVKSMDAVPAVLDSLGSDGAAGDSPIPR